MSQPVETQPKRTGYPTAAGAMTIVSACLLIVIYSVLIFSYPITISYFFWSELSSLAVSIMFNVLSLLGGVLALTRTRFVFAVFGTSILIPPSLSTVTFTLASLARALTGDRSIGNFTISVYTVLFIAIYPIVLVLSMLSLIFLARSRHEFR